MTMLNETAQTLPGFDEKNLGVGDNPMRRAVQNTLDELKGRDLLDARHEAMAQLALELADAVTKAGRSSKTYAIAQVAGALREVLNDLPKPEQAEAAEAFQQWVEKTLASDPDTDTPA